MGFAMNLVQRDFNKDGLIDSLLLPWSPRDEHDIRLIDGRTHKQYVFNIGQFTYSDYVFIGIQYIPKDFSEKENKGILEAIEGAFRHRVKILHADPALQFVIHSLNTSKIPKDTSLFYRVYDINDKWLDSSDLIKPNTKIASYLTQTKNSDVKTFCVDFEGASFSPPSNKAWLYYRPWCHWNCTWGGVSKDVYSGYVPYVKVNEVRKPLFTEYKLPDSITKIYSTCHGYIFKETESISGFL
jgi:hypothetical protein